MRNALQHSVHAPSSMTPAASHFWISRRTLLSAIRCSRNLSSQSMVKAGEEVAEIRVEHPVHLLARDPGSERVQRIMRASARAETRTRNRESPPCATRRHAKGDEGHQHLIRAGWNTGPGLMQPPGEAGDGQGAGSRVGGQASRQRDGRAVLPDARVRASEIER